MSGDIGFASDRPRKRPRHHPHLNEVLARAPRAKAILVTLISTFEVLAFGSQRVFSTNKTQTHTRFSGR